mgnify:FL=1|tara:strand:- start:50 stop:994 length:945 start_codon:yes stop_codon:yes gene_type:complete
MAAIVSGVNFNVTDDYVYTKAKVNANGRKSVGILNNSNKKSLFLSTPLMLTWGVNEYRDEKTGDVQSYDMALQFPNNEYNSEECSAFLKNMQAFEEKVKTDAIANSKDWLNKQKLVPEAVEALWSPMLKYPKDKETGDSDYSRPPTLKVKIPYWEGEFKGVELYNDERVQVFPAEEDANISDFIVKGSNVATIIQCGGIWVANGKFGVTWKLFQAVVKPRTTLSGKCHITLSMDDKEKIAASNVDVDAQDVISQKMNTTVVEDSDDEVMPTPVPVALETKVEEVKTEVAEELEKQVVVEDQPKKKRVVKKKASE